MVIVILMMVVLAIMVMIILMIVVMKNVCTQRIQVHGMKCFRSYYLTTQFSTLTRHFFDHKHLYRQHMLSLLPELENLEMTHMEEMSGWSVKARDLCRHDTC